MKGTDRLAPGACDSKWEVLILGHQTTCLNSFPHMGSQVLFLMHDNMKLT